MRICVKKHTTYNGKLRWQGPLIFHTRTFFVRAQSQLGAGFKYCWRRSSRGRDCWLTLQVDPGSQRLLPFPWSWKVRPVWSSHSQGHFQGAAALRVRCVETIWICDWSPCRPLSKCFKILVDVYGLSHLAAPRQAYWVSSKLATYSSRRAPSFFQLSLPSLEWG